MPCAFLVSRNVSPLPTFSWLSTNACPLERGVPSKRHCNSAVIMKVTFSFPLTVPPGRNKFGERKKRWKGIRKLSLSKANPRRQNLLSLLLRVLLWLLTRPYLQPQISARLPRLRRSTTLMSRVKKLRRSRPSKSRKVIHYICGLSFTDEFSSSRPEVEDIITANWIEGCHC